MVCFFRGNPPAQSESCPDDAQENQTPEEQAVNEEDLSVNWNVGENKDSKDNTEKPDKGGSNDKEGKKTPIQWIE